MERNRRQGNAKERPLLPRSGAGPLVPDDFTGRVRAAIRAEAEKLRRRRIAAAGIACGAAVIALGSAAAMLLSDLAASGAGALAALCVTDGADILRNWYDAFWYALEVLPVGSLIIFTAALLAFIAAAAKLSELRRRGSGGLLPV